MTTEYCNFTSSLTRSGRSYRIENLYDDYKLYIPEEYVSDIANKTGEEPYLISIILGLTEIIRRENLGERRRKNSKSGKIEIKRKISVITEILSFFSSEEVIDLFVDLKLYELLQIFNSIDPLFEIKEMLQ